MIHIIPGAAPSERKQKRAVRFLVPQSHCDQDMRGLKCFRGTCGTRACCYPQVVELEYNTFTFNEAEPETCIVGKPFCPVARKIRIINIENIIYKPVPQFDKPCTFIYHFILCDPGSFSHACYARDILRTAPHTIFLPSAKHKGDYPHTLFDIQRPDAFGTSQVI